MKFKQPALLLFIAGVVHCANAHTYTFDASMLGDAAKGVDMSLFNQGVQQPGTYRVDVMVLRRKNGRLPSVVESSKAPR